MSRSLRGERGAGSILVLSIMGSIVATTAGVLAVASAYGISRGVDAAADLSALAAADAASGAVSGLPCVAASATAEINRAALDSCDIDGLVARVSVHREFLGIWVVSRARAGPCPGLCGDIGAPTGASRSR